ncbi:hypothetical protein GCM10010234_23140 [Streptomyces hawaiiensis]
MNTPSLARSMKLEPEGPAVRQWIECASCLDADRGEGDVTTWATDHQSLHPNHTRFRTVSQAYFRLAPKESHTP